MRQSVVAIDLGGTKLASAAVDTAGQISLHTKREAKRGDPRASVQQIVEVFRETIAGVDLNGRSVLGLGVLVPGVYFADSGNAWAPNLWRHEQVPLRAELERELDVPVVIDSDRAGYVTGERWLGAAKGLTEVVFLAVGTGIGAGIVARGQLLRGVDDVAGAVGWFALNPDAKDLYKHIGCWEAEAAGPALARRGNASSAEDVITAARKSHPAAQDAVRQTAKYLGMGIANIVSLLNPEMIVLGGGLMRSADLFIDSIKREVAEWAQPIAAQRVRVVTTKLGEDAGLLGAARLTFDRLSIEVNH